ncbi:MAG: hypothetical protein KDA84_27120, partial [Planctomycetaceae bacterium]|nr:hypothetical protein [Planctomycetaceae bacterium]
MRKAIFVVMLATWTLNLPAQEPDPDDRPDPELELELTLAQEEIVQFEPLVYEITVRNLSDNPQEVSTEFDRCWQTLKIHLTDPAGKTSYLGTGLICCGLGGKMTLPPKRWRGSVHHQNLFLPFSDGWLGTPGRYQLHATFSAVTGMKPLESKLVPLTIKPAKGDDKEVLKILRGKDHAKFLSCMFGDGKIAKDFETLIQKYPKSHY